MQLLGENQAADAKKTKEDERAARIIRMSEEESKTVRELNEIRVTAEAEKKKIASDLESFRASAETEKGELTREISSLKARRDDLMKPIDEIVKEAEGRLEGAKQAEKAIVSRETAVSIREANAGVREAGLDDRERTVAELELATTAEVSRIGKEGETLRLAQNALAGATKAHNERVSRENKEIENGKKMVAAGLMANATVREFLDKEKKTIADDRRALQDAYVALEQAKKHLGIQL